MRSKSAGGGPPNWALGRRPELTAARSYIAGIGASGALVGAAVLAIVLLGTLLAFEGFPIAGGGANAESVQIDAGEDGVATATAAALGAAPTAVAAAPGAAAGAAPAAAGGGAGAGAGAGGYGAGVPGAPGDTGTTAPGAPGAPAPGPTAPAPPGAPAPTAPSSGNPVSDAASGVDSVVEGATGVNPNLGDTTAPLTDGVDQVLEDTTDNDLGGHVDNVTGALP
jgi:hypothetical protein